MLPCNVKVWQRRLKHWQPKENQRVFLCRLGRLEPVHHFGPHGRRIENTWEKYHLWAANNIPIYIAAQTSYNFYSFIEVHWWLHALFGPFIIFVCVSFALFFLRRCLGKPASFLPPLMAPLRLPAPRSSLKRFWSPAPWWGATIVRESAIPRKRPIPSMSHKWPQIMQSPLLEAAAAAMAQMSIYQMRLDPLHSHRCLLPWSQQRRNLHNRMCMCQLRCLKQILQVQLSKVESSCLLIIIADYTFCYHCMQHVTLSVYLLNPPFARVSFITHPSRP